MGKLPTLKPVFNRNNRINKSGLYSIHIRITLGRQTGYVSLHGEPRIAISDWNENPTYKDYVLNTHPLFEEINQDIDNVINKIYKVIRNHYEKNLTLKILLKELKNKN